MKLLAFDLGTKTGCAIGDASDRPYCHTEVLGQSGKDHGARLTQALQMTLRLIKQHKPDAVVIELPIAAGVKGGQERVQLAMGLRAAVKIACFLQNVTFHEYHVQSIRAHFIGDAKTKRAAAKAQTMERCARLGWHVQTDDQGDAAAVWDYARAQLAKISTATPGGLFDEQQHGKRRGVDPAA